MERDVVGVLAAVVGVVVEGLARTHAGTLERGVVHGVVGVGVHGIVVGVVVVGVAVGLAQTHAGMCGRRVHRVVAVGVAPTPIARSHRVHGVGLAWRGR